MPLCAAFAPPRNIAAYHHGVLFSHGLLSRGGVD